MQRLNLLDVGPASTLHAMGLYRGYIPLCWMQLTPRFKYRFEIFIGRYLAWIVWNHRKFRTRCRFPLSPSGLTKQCQLLIPIHKENPNLGALAAEQRQGRRKRENYGNMPVLRSINLIYDFHQIFIPLTLSALKPRGISKIHYHTWNC